MRRRRTASVNTTLQNRELLVGAADEEVKALVVVVGVRIRGAAGGVALLVVGAGSVGGSTDLGSCVRGGAAGGGRLAALDRAGDGDAQERSQRKEGLDEVLVLVVCGINGVFVGRQRTDLEDEHCVK